MTYFLRMTFLRTQWFGLVCCNSTATAVSPVQYNCRRNFVSNAKGQLPVEADVVVIGGGSVGCSTAYHLAKFGAGKVLLLERDKLTAGTTWHTSGLLWRVATRHLEMQIVSRTHELMTSVLSKEVGAETGWVQTGGLFTACNDQRMEAYRVDIYLMLCARLGLDIFLKKLGVENSVFGSEYIYKLAKVLGIEAFLLSTDEMREVHPLLDVSQFVGALYSPLDGTMDPTATCASYAKAAEKYGAQIFQSCRVNGVDTNIDDFGTRRVSSVRTNLGTVRTGHVINCAGVWAPKIGQMVGVETPQVAFRQAYAVTQPIEGARELPNVRHHDAGMYLKRQGETLQVGGYEKNPILCETVADDFNFGLYDLDWDVYGPLLQFGCDIMPAIAKSGIRTTICGPESFTPDGNPLIGESAAVRGFFYGSGFNGGGMMLGGGAGEQIAMLALHGKPELDIFSWDIKRFPTRAISNRTWIKERSHESYVTHYNIVYPNDQPLAGRNLQSDPLHQVLLGRGCFYEEKHGWERPAYFSKDAKTEVKQYDFYGAYGNRPHEDYEYAAALKHEHTFQFPGPVHAAIGRECAACRTSCVLYNTSSMGKLVLEGPDASEAAKFIFSRDVTSDSSRNEGTQTLMLNDKGGLEAHLVVHKMDDDGNKYLMIVEDPTTEYCIAHIENVLKGRGYRYTLNDKTKELTSLTLQGPKSGEVLQQVVHGVYLSMLLKDSFAKPRIGGVDVFLVKNSFCGEHGYDIMCERVHVVKVYETIMEQVTNHGGCDAGSRAMEVLGMEAGFPKWCRSLISNDLPLEARLTHLCDVNRQYYGSNAVAEIQNERANKSLAYFTVDDPVRLVGCEAIWRNDEVVGETRVGIHTFTFNKEMALGYIDLKDMANQTVDEYSLAGKYEIECCCVKHKAEVHLTSPFKFRNATI